MVEKCTHVVRELVQGWWSQGQEPARLEWEYGEVWRLGKGMAMVS